MIGNPINYDKIYNDNQALWSKPSLDAELKRYIKLLNGKNVLDLGVGEGQNSVALAESGYNVTGVDISGKALEICKSNFSNINILKEDIRTFNIIPNNFDLIMSRCVFHFLHKNDVISIINNIKNNLNPNGLVYILVFSTNDPGIKKKYNNPNFDILENNVFHNLSDDTYKSYFSKNEILELFSDFETIFISDEYSLDLSHGKPHYHGYIKYIGQKITKYIPNDLGHKKINQF